ncbi:GAF domain-containing protein [Halopelagius longus]|uniref:histidine kinase n=1 Tax=Halopelagius longus TaxID=1236180 RepID=A0A1H1AVD7_9EURY|nr:GAF domain-containing protein [Halopelagius longus]RDI70532.1 GAF domain-containing protein [Halopelagius longus]SDQ43647.1 PAS domain S-box-containing protein [Halopelagius longus]
MGEKRDSESAAPIRTLYIDDDESLLELTRRFLETETPRIEVETASSPRRGLESIERREVDVVVCDYQMPEMDGVEVLETVRQTFDDDVPFIVFTGEGRKEVAIEALNLGADRYLRKGGDPTSQYGVLARTIVQEYEHHRTQRRLRKREENLRVTLESIGDAVVTTDVDGRVTRMNPVAEDLTGWSTDEAVGEPLSEVFEIIDHETREPEANPAERVLETGSAVGLANGTVLVGKDGTERFIADSASPIADECGEMIGVVLVFRDVTDDYRSRERQARQRRTVVELSTDERITDGDFEAGKRTITETAAETLDVDRVGIWLFEDGNSVLRNADLYERSADAHTEGEELAADDYPAYFEALEAHRSLAAEDARSDPRTAELAAEYLEPYGIGSVLDATIRSNGDVVGVVCHEHVGEPREWTDDERRFAGEIADQVLRVLSNRRQRERERALEELHGIATDITTFDSPEAVCRRTIDVAENILEFDQCVINLEDDGMLPVVAVSEVVPSDGVTAMSVDDGIVGKTYRTGETFLFDDVRDAEEANPQGPYRGALSVPVGDHGVFQAVSERAGAFDEDDVELAELLVSHTGQALDQLESKRELRQQNERLDEFSSVVSHDLRNPLNVAQGRLELAAEECDSDHLRDVANAHERMARLIDDLLELAREGETTADTEPVALGDAVESAWRNVETADATLIADVGRVVRADEGRMQQLLENLVRNAVEHGGPAVTVRVGESPHGFYVEDDGPGVPPDRRDDVFETGYSTTRDGTGFGLSIVRRIADAHGWEVTAAEGPEGGGRFEITGVEFLD